MSFFSAAALSLETEMNKASHDFETWFETLQTHVAERTGRSFSDMDSVRSDYEDGRDVFDVVDEICTEYGGN